MKRTIQLLTIAAGLALGASSASADVTIYRQTFTTASGSGANNYSPTNWNWVSYVGTSSYCTQQDNYSASSPSVYIADYAGYPNNLYNSNATANAGISSPNPAYGYANFRAGSGNASVLFLSATAPGELDASGGIDRSRSVTLDWYWAASGTSGNSPGLEYRLAVNVGGTWYVTTNTWVPTVASSGSTFGSGTGVGHAFYTQNNNATNAWQVLPLNVGTSFATPTGTPAALPAGVITQVGLYFNAGSSTGNLKGYLDSFSISQQPPVVASATTTSLASSFNPSTFGDSVTFTATIQTNGATAGNATSNVVFTVDGTPVATNAVSGGQAAYTTSALTVGSHPISAQYRGDANYLASTGAVTQVVNTLIYRQTLSTALGTGANNYSITNWNWVTYVGTNTWCVRWDGTQVSAPSAYVYDAGGYPNNLYNTNASANASIGSPNPTCGYMTFRPFVTTYSVLYLSATATNITATSELNASGGIDRSQSVTFDWYWGCSATSGGSLGIEYRLAVNVGGTWYVTTNTWVPTVASTASTFTNGTGVGHAVYTQNNNATNAWLVLPVNVGTSFGTPSGSPAALPAGTITQAGVYFNSGTAGAKGYWDNFSISQQYKVATTTTTVASSVNPSAYGQSVGFTATVQTNSATASDATGNIVFSVDGTAVATNAVAGGSATYTAPALAAGSHTIQAAYSGGGSYYLFSTGSLTQTVNQAALDIYANNDSKTYGQTRSYGAGSTAFTTGVGQLVAANGDAVTSVTLSSSGAAASATFTSPGPTYAIAPSVAVGSGLGNYAITYHDGTLTVNQAALDIYANNDSKTYGQTKSYGAGSMAFTTGASQLIAANGDAVTSVTLSSSGGAASATFTSPGPTYAIAPSVAVGSGLGNYAITYHDGTLTLSQAALEITASDDSKTYGQTKSYGAGSTAFTTGASQLVVANGDAVSSVTLASSGAAASATFTSPGPTYAISPTVAVGSGLGNYAITYHDGTLTLSQAALDITANNDSKTYGQTKSYGAGSTAFTTGASQLVTANGDAVTSVTLASSGAAASATCTTPGPTYAITPSAAAGSGLGNYAIAYHDGTLTVNPASSATAVASSSNPSLPAASVTFTATVSSGAGTPTSQVRFLTNGTPAATVSLDGSGEAAYSTALLPHGSNTVSAEYLGDGNFLASTGAVAQVVNTPPVARDIAMGASTSEPATLRIIGGKFAPTDADLDPLTVTAVGAAANGTVTTDGTNVTYTSANTFTGTNTFTYTVSDGFGGAATRTVTVRVTANGTGFNLVSGPVNNGDGTATINYMGIPGYKYALDTTTSLALPITWAPVLTNTAGSDGKLSFTFSTAAGEAYFRTHYVP